MGARAGARFETCAEEAVVEGDSAEDAAIIGADEDGVEDEDGTKDDSEADEEEEEAKEEGEDGEEGDDEEVDVSFKVRDDFMSLRAKASP